MEGSDELYRTPRDDRMKVHRAEPRKPLGAGMAVGSAHSMGRNAGLSTISDLADAPLE